MALILSRRIDGSHKRLLTRLDLSLLTSQHVVGTARLARSNKAPDVMLPLLNFRFLSDTFGHNEFVVIICCWPLQVCAIGLDSQIIQI